MTTMADIVRQLPLSEQRLICKACNEHGVWKMQIHPGILPLLKREEVFEAFQSFRYGNPDVRHYAVIAEKLRGPKGSTFCLYLDDVKVHKRFGRHPERGVRLRGRTTKVTAGLKWSLPKKTWVPDEDVIVEHTIALKKLKPGYWQVVVTHNVESSMKVYLMQQCGPDKDHKPRFIRNRRR